MSESVASVRETSSAKNNSSGNVRSNNGGLYYTTSTQYTDTVTNTKNFNGNTTVSGSLPGTPDIEKLHAKGNIHGNIAFTQSVRVKMRVTLNGTLVDRAYIQTAVTTSTQTRGSNEQQFNVGSADAYQFAPTTGGSPDINGISGSLQYTDTTQVTDSTSVATSFA